ncbi:MULTISPECIES: tetraacyldisaccharide 4'-kinase [unclassified Agarivorans]|uniref:tetraacyldisaccharide 4'-kinase n=1 Tax=unclassified Agarivorans TaxID=2636026 RepID=UPI003D7EF76B
MKFWYQSAKQHWFKIVPLLLFSYLFRFIARLRRLAYQQGWLGQYVCPVPVVVVGNISVGGNGKTPVVLALVEAAKKHGFKPGVVSRGYGAKAPHYPFQVDASSDSEHCGDEPLLIYLRSRCPVMVDPNRSRACHAILQAGVDLIICDDGMQHYALARDIEIAVIDAQRGLGNGLCLPAGPLREPASRLARTDIVISNGEPAFSAESYILSLQASAIRKVMDDSVVQNLSTVDLALAGIGNPQRFFSSLIPLGIHAIEHMALDDHRPLTLQQQRELFNKTLIMTEKDAIKYRHTAGTDWYYLPVDSVLPAAFYQHFFSLLQEKTNVSRT